MTRTMWDVSNRGRRKTLELRGLGAEPVSIWFQSKVSAFKVSYRGLRVHVIASGQANRTEFEVGRLTAVATLGKRTNAVEWDVWGFSPRLAPLIG